MLRRCYDPYYINKELTYIDCYVCDEWLCFQNFGKWWEVKVMNELINNGVTMTSLEVVELVNKLRKEEGNEKIKRHDNFIRDIDKELESLRNVGISTFLNFEEWYYEKDGRKYRCYKLNMQGIMQMLNKESAYVRYKTQQYIEALENKLKQRESYMIDDPVERALAWAEEEKERRRLKLENQEVKEENKQLKNEIDEYKDFKKLREILEANVSDMRVGDFSKLLYNNGIKIGRNNLYRWLQVNKYICKVYGHFSPKQQYLDNGYLSYIDEFVDTPQGTQVQYHILITPKGALQIAKKLFEEQFIKNNFKNSKQMND